MSGYPHDPEDWWHEYEPEAIPGTHTALGHALALIIAPLLIATIAWTALAARWRR